MKFKKIYSVVVLFPLVVLICLWSLRYSLVPWLWVDLAIAVWLLIAGRIAEKQLSKIILFNLAAVPFAFFLAELYYYVTTGQEQIVSTGTYATKSFFKKDDQLGYRPIPSITCNLKRLRGKETVCDVTYTINADGLRDTPSSNNNSDKCLLFFGCSFAFGECLNDQETLPYFMGNELPGKYKILNFGFQGYGPHQMLAALETGIVDNVIKGCQQVDVVYSAIPHHVARAAGYSPWDKHGPKYVLEKQTLVHKGAFDGSQVTTSVLNRVKAHMLRSPVLKKLLPRKKIVTSDLEKDTFIAILERAQALIKRKYSDARFMVFFWDANYLSNDSDKKDSEIIIKKLAEKGFEYYQAQDALEDYNKDPQRRYTVGKYDGHPSAEANKLIAAFLKKKLETQQQK
ncbi:hypothetical protein [Candidatus Electronema sp. PJ]|uniref:hypothetical protein n=1 Tax=Candidatus Electronema sp. PJ TaxID=3401572 RepID=UPI003AA9212F